MSEPVKTPISEGLIDRVVRGVKYVVSGADKTWFSPQQPLPPFAQEAAGRQFDYQVGYNLQQQPKVREGVTFGELRALADGLDMLRLVIETRKDMMCKLQFEIKPIDEDKASDDRCKEVMEFLRFPDKEHTWDEWLRMLLEDLFVLDAPTLYPRMTYGGGLFALEPVDGSTIKRVIDGTGRTPVPPSVAYQQVLKGVPAVDYNRDELIYKPRNVRTNRVYGYSPVEQIIMTVNIALRRQMYQLQFYTEGSTPDLIFSVPEQWNPDQVKQFSDWWQSMLSGNTANRRKTMFVPHGVDPVNTKEGILKDEYDEWLTRIICFAFSISPQSMMNEMNRATAETAREMAIEEGLSPVMQWVKNLVDYIVWKYFGYTDLHLTWKDERDPDPLQQAQVDEIYLRNDVLQPNEVRERLGMEALTPEQEAAIAARKVQAAQQAMGGKPDEGDDDEPPPDDGGKKPKPTEKMEDADLKKAERELTPLNRQRAAIVTVEGKLATLMTSALESLRKQAIEQLTGQTEKADSDKKAEQYLKNLNLDWDATVEAVAKLLREAAIDGATVAAEQIGMDDKIALNLAHDAAEEYAWARAAEMVGKKWVGDKLKPNPNAAWRIDETTRDVLRNLVTSGIEEGWSNEKLANAIEDSKAFGIDRARMIARTETAMADVEGNMAAYREAEAIGIKMKKKWITANDDKVSPDCAMNGASPAIALDKEFPSGAMQPPDHPNCRCDVLPVVVKGKKE